MFTGTEYTADVKTSNYFENKIAALPSTMAQDNPALFQTYHVVADENADGSFTPQYPIENNSMQ